MPGDPWQELAGLRTLYAYQWSHPGKQLLFMGQEFGQGTEWNADTSLDWWILDDPGHQGLLSLVSDLNRLYLSSPACGQRTSPTGDSSGSRPATATTTSCPTCARGPTPTGGPT